MQPTASAFFKKKLGGLSASHRAIRVVWISFRPSEPETGVRILHRPPFNGVPGQSQQRYISRRHLLRYEKTMRGKGSQKKARLERLKNEIIDYVTQAPGASAADIVAFLSNERKMRNHGLTTRKVGLFIPLHLSEIINFRLDSSTGKRIYHLAP